MSDLLDNTIEDDNKDNLRDIDRDDTKEDLKGEEMVDLT